MTPSPFRLGWHYPEGDPSILLFDHAVRQWQLDLPQGARVLELGCAETNFSHWLLQADPSIRLTGVDVNEVRDFKGDTLIRGAAEAQDFAASSFEAVILLGSLEHFGLGYYGDPVNEDADIETLLKIHDWLWPGGWVYYDVPWTPHRHYVTENRHFRVYDDCTLPGCDGLVPKHRRYAHGQTNQPQPTRPEQPTTPFWYCARLLEKPA